MYLDLQQGKRNMFIEPQLGSFRPQYVEPSLQGFGSLGSISSGAAQILQAANSAITPLPSPVIAAIDSLPITYSQKKALKNSPVSFFIVLADASQDKVIEFITKTQSLSRKSSVYTISGKSVTVNPKKTDSPAFLAAQFLTVANQNPIIAAQVAATMALEIGGAVLASAGAAISQGAQDIQKGVSTAAKNTVTAAQNTVTAAQKAAEKVASDAQRAADLARKQIEDAAQGISQGIQNMWPFGNYTALGDGGVVSGPAAVAAGGSAATAVTMAEIVGLVTAAVSLAGLIVPPLMSIITGAPIAPATSSQKNAATNAAVPGGAMDQAMNNLPGDAKTMIQDSRKIFGLPRNAVVYGGAATGIGVLAYIIFKFKG